MTDRWNHNIHHHPLVLGAVRPGHRSALDVGCGEGQLTRELRAVLPEVTGVDADGPSIDLARAQDPDGTVRYLHGDVRTLDLPPADVVTAVAVLHHVDAADGLRRLRELVAPGGVLVVVGLARGERRDLAVDLTATAAHRLIMLRRTEWEHPSPTVWPPPQTYAEVRRTAEEVLPGVRYRRHLLWRYSLTWSRT